MKARRKPLRPFDPARYFGSDDQGKRPRYTPAQLVILCAGTVGLLAAISCKKPEQMIRVAKAAHEHNRLRFTTPAAPRAK